MNKKQFLGSSVLLLASLIWGCAFVAQSVAGSIVEPFTFQATRSFLGTLVLIPVVLVLDSVKRKKPNFKKPSKEDNRFLLKGGIACGIVLTIATILQQVGLTLGTSAGKSGFITTMYILLVPVFGLAFKKRVLPIIWLCVVLGMVGLYLLCMADGFTLARGDFYTLLCSVAFTIHILTVDYFSPKTDGVKLSLLQFAVMTIISGTMMFIFENPSWENIKSAWLPICYAGIMSSGIAYTLQIVGQKNTEPAIASLLMSFESVFAVLAGIIILHETPSMQEATGCVIMFTAVIISQLPQKRGSNPP